MLDRLVPQFCVALLISALLPSATMAQPRELRAICAVHSCPPEQTSRLFSQIDQQAAEIERLARAHNVSTSLLRAAVFEIGLRDGGLSNRRLIEIIAERAKEASRLETKIANLESRISLLTDSSLRDPALAALARARSALDEGNLREAEGEFASLRVLRSSQTTEAQMAWRQAVEAEAETAHMRGASARRSEILRQARELTLLQAEYAAWRLATLEAAYHLEDGDLRGLLNAYEQAIEVYQSALIPIARRIGSPQAWAAVQTNIGTAYSKLGERSGQSGHLISAIAAYEMALTVRTRREFPKEWAATSNNLANALRSLGGREIGLVHLRGAVALYQEVLEIRTREIDPLGWAQTQNNLGNALSLWGERERSATRLSDGLAAYAAALEERTESERPLEWAQTQHNMGIALRNLGFLTDRMDHLEESVAAYRRALRVRQKDRYPALWVETMNSLGNSLAVLGMKQAELDKLTDAEVTFLELLREITAETAPVSHSRTVLNLGLTQARIGWRRDDLEALKMACDTIAPVKDVVSRLEHSSLLSQEAFVQSEIDSLAHSLGYSDVSSDSQEVQFCQGYSEG